MVAANRGRVLHAIKISRFDDRGFGRHSDVGAGAAFLIIHGLALQIEVSRVNLSTSRASLAAGYRW